MDAKSFTIMADLIDLYQALLTSKQKDIMVARFHQDFSLSEISEQKNISRSAVQDTIKKASEKLLSVEEELGFLNQKTTLKEVLETLENTPLNEAQKTLIKKMKEVL
jgi:predicted DNA-binding protein YlxM (UPF0122 family)